MIGVWDGTRGTYVEIDGNDSVPQRRVERQVPTVVPPISLGHPGVGELSARVTDVLYYFVGTPGLLDRISIVARSCHTPQRPP